MAQTTTVINAKAATATKTVRPSLWAEVQDFQAEGDVGTERLSFCPVGSLLLGAAVVEVADESGGKEEAEIEEKPGVVNSVVREDEIANVEVKVTGNKKLHVAVVITCTIDRNPAVSVTSVV